jgi:hypothetical protein
MLRRIASSSLLALAACSCLALTAIAPDASGAAPPVHQAVLPTGLREQGARAVTGVTPGIDPGYIYAQLDHLVTHFRRREAGYLAGAGGHAGFARYWSSQMLALLGPFGATARTFKFPVRGWFGRPATAPAADV